MLSRHLHPSRRARFAKALLTGVSALSGAMLLLAGGAAELSAQNLVVNSGFDTDLGGWEVGPTTTWDGTKDAGGSSASGSARSIAIFDSTFGGSTEVVTQCVNLTGSGGPYSLSGKIFIPVGQASGGAALSVGFLPGPNCTGVPFPGTVGLTELVTATNAWVPATATVGTFGQSARIAAFIQAREPGTLEVNFDNLTFEPAAEGCTPSANTLCLFGGRFKISATFDTGRGSTGAAHTVGFTSDGGYLWFFDPANVEAIVKVVDGCGLGGHYWFFAGGLTNVGVTITVTDTKNGAVKTYTNPADTAFRPIQDTAAFPCG
jgi:hypothetical protein